MKRKILLLTGSMQEGGNTSKMALAFRVGAEEKGHSVTTLKLRNMNINHCLGCNTCIEKKNFCIQKDDMTTVYDLFEENDTIVFAIPLYFHAFPSLVKAVIDRLYAWGAKYDFAYPAKDCALLATASDSFKETYNELMGYYRYVFMESLKWTDLGALYVTDCGGTTTPRSVEKTTGLEDAKELGRSM